MTKHTITATLYVVFGADGRPIGQPFTDFMVARLSVVEDMPDSASHGIWINGRYRLFIEDIEQPFAEIAVYIGEIAEGIFVASPDAIPGVMRRDE